MSRFFSIHTIFISSQRSVRRLSHSLHFCLVIIYIVVLVHVHELLRRKASQFVSIGRSTVLKMSKIGSNKYKLPIKNCIILRMTLFVVNGNNLHAWIDKFQLNTCQVPRHALTRRLNNELSKCCCYACTRLTWNVQLMIRELFFQAS